MCSRIYLSHIVHAGLTVDYDKYQVILHRYACVVGCLFSCTTNEYCSHKYTCATTIFSLIK